MKYHITYHISKNILLLLIITNLLGCDLFKNTGKTRNKTVMFIGVDISGSFITKPICEDALQFASYYIYLHLNGYGNSDKISNLFVGSIGGFKINEPKSFYPIQTFEHKTIKEIYAKLKEIFPKNKVNNFTDYNAFFKQIADIIRSRKLIMRPIVIVLFTDGIPDMPQENNKQPFRKIKLTPLENLSRDLTIRVLYTSAPIGQKWQNLIPRQRVKIWTQDAEVMKQWKDPSILLKDKPFSKQDRFFKWVKDNVDFKTIKKRVY